MIDTLPPPKPDLSHETARDKITGGTRSPHWPAVEHAFRKKFPSCAACGSKKKINVHHKKPFHLHPEFELDPNNLISLCMDNECHLKVGHGGNFKAYNPEVVTDSTTVFAGKKNLKIILEQVSAKAKADRLFE